MKINQLEYIRSAIDTQSDYVGASASTLCLVHCMLTPVLFAVQATSLSCADISPAWWQAIDFLFLVISFFAIYFTARSSTSVWVSRGLYFWWFILALIIVNATFQWLSIPHSLVYIPALVVSGLHLYNRKYCRCQDDECCAEEYNVIRII